MLLGAAGQAYAGLKGADAQKDAAVAQLSEARAVREQAMSIAAPSAQELAQIQRQTQVSEQAIARQEQLLAAVDPALIEAGKQALGLLKGEHAAALAPLEQERARQRGLLENQLKNQLGAGYATSSAGQEALNRFDQQTAQTLSGAQQQTLGALLGVAQNVRPNQTEMVNLAGAPLAAQNRLKERQLYALFGSPTTPYAGGPAMADAAKAKAVGSIFGGVSQMAGAAFGAQGGFGALFGGGGGAGAAPAGGGGLPKFGMTEMPGTG
jgi:hypothetical protein